jgi:hypothetical protein
MNDLVCATFGNKLTDPYQKQDWKAFQSHATVIAKAQRFVLSIGNIEKAM